MTEHSFQTKKDSVVEAPDYKHPAGAMPKSTKEHNHSQIDVGSPGSVAITAKWNVQIIA